MDNKRKKLLIELENILKVRFKNMKLLENALTHTTFAVENSVGRIDNERLEFLGDAVLGLAVSGYLYNRFKDYSEGELSMARSKIVNEKNLSRIARQIHIGKYLLLGRGERISGGRNKDSIISSTLEAVIGAVYLECGFERTHRFIVSNFKKSIDVLSVKKFLKDPKGILQETSHKIFGKTPFYQTMDLSRSSGHHFFKAKVIIGKSVLSAGTGITKKEAEEKAAIYGFKKIKARLKKKTMSRSEYK